MTGVGIDGVVFDLDGVLVDSEHLWEMSWAARSAQAGVPWEPEDTAAVQGMSVPEWSAYVADHIETDGSGMIDPRDVARSCVDYVIRCVVDDGEGAPLPGARKLVESISARVPIALASSAGRRAIDAILDHHGLAEPFSATVSSEEVEHGKPSPDVYLEAVRRLGLDPTRCAAVEDSNNGILAAARAGLLVIAVPNPHYPPGDDALRRARFVAPDLTVANDRLSALLAEGSLS